MSHYEIVIERCKKLERQLQEGFSAEGRGLHEKVTSIGEGLPEPLVKKLRYIATIRNKLVHEDEGNTIKDLEGYNNACDQAEEAINDLVRPKSDGTTGCNWIFWVVGIIIVLILLGSC